METVAEWFIDDMTAVIGLLHKYRHRTGVREGGGIVEIDKGMDFVNRG